MDLSIWRFSILDQIQLSYYPLHLVAPTCDVMQFIHVIVRVFLFPQAFFNLFRSFALLDLLVAFDRAVRALVWLCHVTSFPAKVRVFLFSHALISAEALHCSIRWLHECISSLRPSTLGNLNHIMAISDSASPGMAAKRWFSTLFAGG